MNKTGLRELLREHIQKQDLHNLTLSEYEQAVRAALEEIKNTGK